MSNILCVHEQADFFIDRNSHLRSDDVVLRVLVIVDVEPKNILIGFVDLLGMEWSEFSVRARITEIKRELPGLHLYWKRIDCRRREIDSCPRLLSERPQNEDLQTDQDERCSHEPFGPSGKGLDLGSRLPARKHPDEHGENNLCRKETDTGFDHRVRQLLVYLIAVRGNICRGYPDVGNDWNSRSDCDHNQSDCQELSHGFPISPVQ